MNGNFPKLFLSWLFLGIGGAYAALCVTNPHTFLQPPVFLTVIAVDLAVVGVLWWTGRVWWWAALPAILGVGFVLFVGLVVQHLELTGPPY